MQANFNPPYLSSVARDQAGKEYWYGEFHRLKGLFPSVASIAGLIGPYDEQFKPHIGLSRVANVAARTASCQLARETVEAMCCYINEQPELAQKACQLIKNEQQPCRP